MKYFSSLDSVFKLGYGMLIGTIALVIYASLVHAQQPDQPEQEITYPPCFFNPLCTCSKVVPDLGHVTCRNIPLARIPRHINNSRVYILQLENNGLRHIEPYFLEATNLFRIEISRNNLTDVTPEAFVGLERTLWEVDLHSNHLTSIPSRAIRHLQKLRLLNLTDNAITDVAAENWRGVEESLETLILRSNGISHLHPDVFSALTNLQTLDIGGNALIELGPNVFHDGPPRLLNLILADNAIHSFPYQQVSNLRMLHNLDLSRNQITQLQNMAEDAQNARVSLSLDILRLDYNQLQFLPTRGFENFRSINTTYLDGNPISFIQVDSFKGPKMKQLYLRDCGIVELAPGAFAGLEPSLNLLDLSGNNITQLPIRLFQGFDFLRTLSLRDNLIIGVNPQEAFNDFQYSIIHLDLSGAENSMIAIQDLRNMRSLRSLTMSRLPQPNLSPDDFQNVGVDVRELKISNGNLKGVKNHAFRNVQSLEKLDLSENSITALETEAFAEVGDSLTYLNLASGFSSSMSKLPAEAFRPLTTLQRLDISNNHIKTLPETSFHFMRSLQVLHMEDNLVDVLPKGTFQGDIHVNLEKIFLSFNQLSSIATHSFVGLRKLDTLHLDDNRLNRVEKRSFMNLERLKHLSLRGNKLNHLAEESFQNLPALRNLDLAYNDMRTFDFSCLDQVGTLSSFGLNMSHNSLRQLENNSTLYVTDRMRGGVISTNIQELDFSHNNITSIGRWYFRAIESSLTHLHLSHNSLRNLTRDLIGNIRHLQWIDVGYNRIEEIEFDTFKSTQNLQVLIARNNYLYELPPEIFRGLGNLRVVDLSENRLRTLPDIVFFEKGLEVFRARGNQLTRVPVGSFSQDAASSLVHLDVSDNSITALHPADVFGKFQSLQYLDLSKNRLVRIEDGAFSQLPSLFSLDLSDNTELTLESKGLTFHGIEDSLQELYLRNLSMHLVPEMHLPTLRLLDLSDNSVSMVPQDLPQNLSSLRTLLMSGNSLNAVPTALPHFTQLRTLNLARNPITSLAFASGLRLRELDIRHLPLETFEVGTLGRIPTLRTLHLSPSTRDMNLPHLLQDNSLLERLHIEVSERERDSSLGQIFNGPLPFKLRELEISGRAVKTLPNNLLQGIRSSDLSLTLFNTTVENIPRSVFERATYVRTLKLDVRRNSLRKLGNPNTATQPGMPRKTFLMSLKMAENHWSCDCELGWVEGWERKKRQFFCTETWDACRTLDDDLRFARCDNKQHQRLLEVLKTDLECGWNAALSLQGTTVLVLTFIALLLTRA